MIHIVGWLLLLTLTTTRVSCHRTVDTNRLLYELFSMNRKDTSYMDHLAQHFVNANGDVDKLWNTARDARSHRTDQRQEAVTILEAFHKLPQATQTYLTTEFPHLKALRTPFIQKSMFVVETTTDYELYKAIIGGL